MMKMILLFAALCPLVFAGCLRSTAAKNPSVEATPAGPCRDDEQLENGRCAPRIPGDMRPPAAK